MATDTEKRYTYLNFSPRSDIRKIAKQFKQETGHWLDKMILNPKYSDIGTEYMVLHANFPPSIQPLLDDDIPGINPQQHPIAIEYDKAIDENTVVCRGTATTEE